MKALERTPWAHRVYLATADRNSRWHRARQQTSKFRGLKSCTKDKQPLLLGPGQTAGWGGKLGDERLVHSAPWWPCRLSWPSFSGGGGGGALFNGNFHLGPTESNGVLKGGTRGFEAAKDQRSYLLLGQTQHPRAGTVPWCCCWGIKYSIYFQRMRCSIQWGHGEGIREGKEKHDKERQFAQHFFSIFPNLKFLW